MEENRGLRWLIQQEGALQEFSDVSPEVLVVSARFGYQEGLYLVLDMYKPAGRCRQAPSGVNLNAGSLQGFGSFIQACEDAVSRTTNPVIQALLLHNAGSASAPHNGNTRRQVEFNFSANLVLDAIPEASRDDDWQCVWEKVMVALYENDAVQFVEFDYRKILDSMWLHGSKDTAGRREFLAKWLDQRGWRDEALEVLKLVEADATSDPTQRSRALELLKKLTPGIIAILLFAFQFVPRFAVAFQ